MIFFETYLKVFSLSLKIYYNMWPFRINEEKCFLEHKISQEHLNLIIVAVLFSTRMCKSNMLSKVAIFQLSCACCIFPWDACGIPR